MLSGLNRVSPSQRETRQRETRRLLLCLRSLLLDGLLSFLLPVELLLLSFGALVAKLFDHLLEGKNLELLLLDAFLNLGEVGMYLTAGEVAPSE